MAQLEGAGAGRGNVFCEKVSGAGRDSPQLTRLLVSPLPADGL